MLPNKTLPSLLLICLTSLPAWASGLPLSKPPGDTGVPCGSFVELHSCELFAGPCVINSEVNQTGNYVLHAWQFDRGSFRGVPLRGLAVALLEKGQDTLAVAGNHATDAVAYVPPGLTVTQRSALVAWARANTAVPFDDTHVRVAPVQAQIAPEKVSFSVGQWITFTGGTPPPCPTGACAQMLWYAPRLAATSFVVDQLGHSRIIEPLLALKWMDHGRQTLFVGRFGDPEVTVPPICNPTETASL